MFSYTFLLFQLLLSYSSIFAKLLLTNFFAPFSAAQESDFLSHFLIPLALLGSTSYMHPHISGTERVSSSKQVACRNLVVDSLPVIFTLLAFCQRFLVQMSVGRTQIIPFLLTKNPQAPLSRVTSPAKLRSTAWVRSLQGISKLVKKG